jgi:hypothetical protein
VISILKYAWRPNFTFLKDRKCIELMISNNTDFISFKKIEKIFQKNVKFGLQAFFFNMEITLTGIGILNPEN